LREELKYIARKLFKLKIHESNGQTFEDLFSRVMSCSNKNFQQVKPQGRIGDKKNDGFDKVNGKYYQVYAPEDISSKEEKAIKKLETDFVGLKKYWDTLCPIKEFYFVINDKYRGAHPDVTTAILNLKNSYTKIKFDLFLSPQFEDCFLNLNDEDIIDIVGHIPEPESLTTLDFNILTEVINYIIKNLKAFKSKEVILNPDFDKKIIFNNLSKGTSEFLNIGNYQVSSVDEFFKYNSNYTKQELRDRFKMLYEEGKEKIGDDSDTIFYYILNEANPFPEKKLPQDAVIVLMSYYFEACDIFEPPTK